MSCEQESDWGNDFAVPDGRRCSPWRNNFCGRTDLPALFFFFPSLGPKVHLCLVILISSSSVFSPPTPPRQTYVPEYPNLVLSTFKYLSAERKYLLNCYRGARVTNLFVDALPPICWRSDKKQTSIAVRFVAYGATIRAICGRNQGEGGATDRYRRIFAGTAVILTEKYSAYNQLGLILWVRV